MPMTTAKPSPFNAVDAYRKHPESLKKLKRYCDRKLAEKARQEAEKVKAA